MTAGVAPARLPDLPGEQAAPAPVSWARRFLRLQALSEMTRCSAPNFTAARAGVRAGAVKVRLVRFQAPGAALNRIPARVAAALERLTSILRRLPAVAAAQVLRSKQSSTHPPQRTATPSVLVDPQAQRARQEMPEELEQAAISSLRSITAYKRARLRSAYHVRNSSTYPRRAQ